MLRYPALGAIWAYQRWLSPHKGYRCAYGALHGGTGCSGYAKHAIRDAGVLRALPLMRARFAACAQAAQDIQALIRDDPKDTRSRRVEDAICKAISCHGCDNCDRGINCARSDTCSSGGECGCSGCRW